MPSIAAYTARAVLPDRVGLVVTFYERPRLSFAYITRTSTSLELQQGGTTRLSNREPRHQETHARNGRLRILVSYVANHSSYDNIQEPGTSTWVYLIPVGTWYTSTRTYKVDIRARAHVQDRAFMVWFHVFVRTGRWLMSKEGPHALADARTTMQAQRDCCTAVCTRTQYESAMLCVMIPPALPALLI